VLKDQYTVFFYVFSLLTLIFKLAIIDAYYKDELRKQRVCSLFIAEYIP
jgi:hypothetical protein